MRRSRARRESTAISLFPFLAVLICTMGALIVLLVIVVKQADVAAKNRREDARAETLAEISELQGQIDEAEFISTEVASARPGLVEQVREATLRRSHYEQQSRELRRKWEELDVLAQAIRSPDAQAAADASAQLAQLQQQVQSLEAAVSEARRARAATRPEYALVAYDGRNGTVRRPIFIECTPGGIDLQPFGIHLDLAEFSEPILPGNPLDAAILAIRDRWLQQDPRGANGAPYPLILVRPNGSNAYAVVREALKSWDSEFGHQIVPQEVDLAYPDNDPRLAQEVQQVIDQAKLKQARMIATLGVLRQGSEGGSGLASGAAVGGAPGGTEGGETPDFVLRASGRHGGFVDTGGSSPLGGSG
ncbi:MAG: hypothetical protein KDA83_20205, partial [Planctomycetales bacterium]|nr:hypothetical protein [Planctomycetales bacterium]